MAASAVIGPNPEPCGGGTGDKGVHAAVAEVRATCGAHLERVVERQVPKPEPGPGQVLVSVAYSSVNPCDWKRVLVNPPPLTLGSEFVGEVVRVAQPCSFKVGDQVWGMELGGAYYAEYALADCDHTGLKPANMGMQEAGALPLVSLTGLMGLEYAGAPWKTQPTVLVLAGSSGTGSVGIQLAKAMGAGRVISTCSEQNFEAVRSFGADQVIDYHKEDWWEVLPKGSVDVIYDCACLAGTGDHAYEIIADHGYFLTIQSTPAASPLVAMLRPSVRQYAYLVSPSHTKTEHLDRLRAFAEGGQLSVPLDGTYELDSVAAAFNKSMEGHTVGKISIHVR